MTINMNVLLSGVVGSVAYGLDTEDSDVDRLGVFAYYTAYLLGLSPVKDTITTTKPDSTMHEAAKFVRLALNVNPTVTELLWLEKYEKITDFGRELISLRKDFLSKSKVRNAYLGYAVQQFRRLEARRDGSFSSDTKKRTAKHARHLARLIDQGRLLYQDGELHVKLKNPQWYHEFGERVANGDLGLAVHLISNASDDFNRIKSCLPDVPNAYKVEGWLLSVRRHFYL